MNIFYKVYTNIFEVFLFIKIYSTLESRESLLSTRSSRDHTQYIETNSLGQRSALANNDGVTFVAAEAWGDVCSNIGMTFLITLVFLDIMKVISAHNDGSVHLGALYATTKDTSTDGDISGEGALLIDVVTLDSLLGGLETETDRFVPSVSALARDFAALLGDLLIAAI